ncbi:MAG: hypothetical protein H6564_08135 [Lewinellaceae bacterium]|nr:hypothetical protein [Lewinellaceae bacterium]
MRPAHSSFRSPVFLLSLALFIGHQLSQKVLRISVPLADGYLDNLLCMPLLLPGLQLQQRWLFGKRALSAGDIWIATAFVAVVSEWLFPRLSVAFTADAWDVAAYFAGGLGYYFFQKKGWA